MLQSDGHKQQDDIKSLGQIILECLEPSAILQEKPSLTEANWDPALVNFYKGTKTKPAHQLLEVRSRAQCSFSI